MTKKILSSGELMNQSALLQRVIPSAYKNQCILEQSQSATPLLLQWQRDNANALPANSAGAASSREAAMNDCQRASHLQYAE
jgi:hypothetical protein